MGESKGDDWFIALDLSPSASLTAREKREKLLSINDLTSLPDSSTLRQIKRQHAEYQLARQFQLDEGLNEDSEGQLAREFVASGLILGRGKDETALNVSPNTNPIAAIHRSQADGQRFTSAVVSKIHCALNITAVGRVYITDLASAHGTTIHTPPSESTYSQLTLSAPAALFDAAVKSVADATRTLSPYVPVLLKDGDVVTLGKAIHSGEVEHQPVELTIRYRFPHLAQTTPSKGSKVEDFVSLTDFTGMGRIRALVLKATSKAAASRQRSESPIITATGPPTLAANENRVQAKGQVKASSLGSMGPSVNHYPRLPRLTATSELHENEPIRRLVPPQHLQTLSREQPIVVSSDDDDDDDDDDIIPIRRSGSSGRSISTGKYGVPASLLYQSDNEEPLPRSSSPPEFLLSVSPNDTGYAPRSAFEGSEHLAGKPRTTRIQILRGVSRPPSKKIDLDPESGRKDVSALSPPISISSSPPRVAQQSKSMPERKNPVLGRSDSYDHDDPRWTPVKRSQPHEDEFEADEADDTSPQSHQPDAYLAGFIPNDGAQPALDGAGAKDSYDDDNNGRLALSSELEPEHPASEIEHPSDMSPPCEPGTWYSYSSDSDGGGQESEFADYPSEKYEDHEGRQMDNIPQSPKGEGDGNIRVRVERVDYDDSLIGSQFYHLPASDIGSGGDSPERNRNLEMEEPQEYPPCWRRYDVDGDEEDTFAHFANNERREQGQEQEQEQGTQGSRSERGRESTPQDLGMDVPVQPSSPLTEMMDPDQQDLASPNADAAAYSYSEDDGDRMTDVADDESEHDFDYSDAESTGAGYEDEYARDDVADGDRSPSPTPSSARDGSVPPEQEDGQEQSHLFSPAPLSARNTSISPEEGQSPARPSARDGSVPREYDHDRSRLTSLAPSSVKAGSTAPEEDQYRSRLTSLAPSPARDGSIPPEDLDELDYDYDEDEDEEEDIDEEDIASHDGFELETEPPHSDDAEGGRSDREDADYGGKYADELDGDGVEDEEEEGEESDAARLYAEYDDDEEEGEEGEHGDGEDEDGEGVEEAKNEEADGQSSVYSEGEDEAVDQPARCRLRLDQDQVHGQEEVHRGEGQSSSDRWSIAVVDKAATEYFKRVKAKAEAAQSAYEEETLEADDPADDERFGILGTSGENWSAETSKSVVPAALDAVGSGGKIDQSSQTDNDVDDIPVIATITTLPNEGVPTPIASCTHDMPGFSTIFITRPSAPVPTAIPRIGSAEEVDFIAAGQQFVADMEDEMRMISGGFSFPGDSNSELTQGRGGKNRFRGGRGGNKAARKRAAAAQKEKERRVFEDVPKDHESEWKTHRLAHVGRKKKFRSSGLLGTISRPWVDKVAPFSTSFTDAVAASAAAGPSGISDLGSGFGSDTTVIPAIQQSHRATSPSDSGSSGSTSDGPVTPKYSLRTLKRTSTEAELDDEIAVVVQTDTPDSITRRPRWSRISQITPSASTSPPAKRAKVDSPSAGNRLKQVGSALGLIVLGAALGSVGTIAGLMQMAD